MFEKFREALEGHETFERLHKAFERQLETFHRPLRVFARITNKKRTILIQDADLRALT